MTCFKIPISICREIERGCARFWWGDSDQKKNLHWLNWKKVCQPKVAGGVGFRELQRFNKALLAKQVWRIWTQPDLLVSKVLKAKYFETSSIMDAKARSNCSFIWRSLVWSRSLARKGGFWKVGNDKSIKAFEDAYVIDFSNGVPIGNIVDLTGTKVAELINNNGGWNEDIIHRFFWPTVAEAIRRTPLDVNREDKLIWKFTENGKFSVKTAYLAKTGYFNSQPNQATWEKKSWNLLVWRRSLPPKIKIFLWRALNELLPVGMNLRDHHLPVSGICDWCKKHFGTTSHTLFFCEQVKSIWKETRFWRFLKQISAFSMRELGKGLRGALGNEDYENWVVLSWMIWKFLCKNKHESKTDLNEACLEKAIGFHENFKSARSIFHQEKNMRARLGEHKWIPPEPGQFRLDVDARYDLVGGSFGIGAIVRDDKGRIRVAMAKPVPKSITVGELEVVATFYGLGLCAQENLGPVVLYSDCIAAVEELKNVEESSCVITEEMANTLKELKQGFLIDVRHMFRSANKVAHNLAKFGANSDEIVLWTKEFPSWLLSFVDRDL